MKNLLTSRIALALVCAAAVLALPPVTAQAHSVAVYLRVEATNGRSLANVVQYTSPAQIRTDPGADCFGPGTGGSGRKVAIPNKTALDTVADALPDDRALRPLSLTDHFSFGEGVCGIGNQVASGDSFWYLKRDHVGSQVGGDQLKVHQASRILWYLAPSFPPGDELALRMPRFPAAGQPVPVNVTAYDDAGTPSAAAGALVSHATAPTNAAGNTTVVLPSDGTFRVQATRSGDIPSNVEVVCTLGRSSPKCKPQLRIFGSPGPDRIRTTGGTDLVKAGAGNDHVALVRGGADRILCGPGRDKVRVHKGDSDDHIAKSCEKVIRK